ncbi:MAG: DUF664 domain-containing protein [Actinomycetes bacterium]
MTSSGILVDAFGRVQEEVHAVVTGLTQEQLGTRLDDQANSIGWLIWHLTRVQDDHLASAAGTEQVWIAQGWADRFQLPFDPRAIGYGQSTDEVAALGTVPGSALIEYYDAVHARTVDFVSGITDADLPRVVDAWWDPPVTLGVRIVSVLADDLQHVGQAAFIRGIVTR